MIHRHRAKATQTIGYTAPVSENQNPRAHGGVTHVERCNCGAVRRINSTGRAQEVGKWYIPKPPRGEE